MAILAHRRCVKPLVLDGAEVRWRSRRVALVAGIAVSALLVAGAVLALRGFTSSAPSHADRFKLTVDKLGGGAVVSRPGGIDCAAGCTDQSVALPAGSTVHLTAAADQGSALAGWDGCDRVSGATCAVTLQADRAVFATFVYTKPIVPATTKVLDEATMRDLQRRAGGTFYFGPQAAGVAHLKVGDVIVSSVGAGFVRRVTGLQVTPSSIVVDSEDAPLSAAIERGTVLLQRTLTPADLAGAQAPASGSSFVRLAAPPPARFTVPLNAHLAPGVRVEGSDAFDVRVDIAVRLDGFAVKEVRSIVTLRDHGQLAFLTQAGFHGHAFDMYGNVLP